MKFDKEEFDALFLEIITENQGLKLYKDNEPSRFKELAVEFGEWLFENRSIYEQYDTNHFKDIHNDDIWSTEEVFNQFLKERNNG